MHKEKESGAFQMWPGLGRKEPACMTEPRVSGLRAALLKAGHGMLGDKETPSECLGHKVCQEEKQRQKPGGSNGWRAAGTKHTGRGGQGAGRGSQGQCLVGLGAESGFSFMYHERSRRVLSRNTTLSDFCF